MTLLISNENVQQALDSGQLQMQAIMDAIEGAYGDLARDKAAYAPRRGVSLPVNESHGHPGFQDERFVFGTMEGGVESSGYFAIRLKLDISYRFEDPATGAKTHEKYCMEPGRYCGLILLVDTNTAEPLAILNDGVVQHLRVAATNAIAAKYMARTDASVLGLYGSGGMARSHAHLMTRVRDLHEIKVYSPTRAHRELFASEIEEELGIPVRAVNAPEALPHECDILAACTDSNVPVISSSALHPGVMLTSVTGSEVDEAAADGIDGVILHQTIDSSTIATYPTSLGRIDQAGQIDPLQHPPNGVYSQGPKVRGTLAQLVSGQIEGRRDDREVNYFYNNIGSGIQFAAIAGEVYGVIRESGAAREIPTEWLTQTIRD